jgi:DNA-binding GntR family transcriptional regulator
MARYKDLRKTLAEEIATGQPPIGARFPTDLELCERFGVSRHTVREALRDLQTQGLLVRQRGSGTVVAAGPAKPIYSQTFQSLGELDAYAAGARFEKMSEGVVVLRPSLAELLDCPINSKWLRIAGVRRLPGSTDALGWTEIYIAEPYIQARARFTAGPDPYYEQIRRQFGLVVREVELRLSAAAIPVKPAAILGVQAGDPAVFVRRRYFALGDTPFEVSLSLHPADRYAYTARLTRGAVGAEPLPA